MIPDTTEVRPIASREEWLRWRREVLTGSDMAAVAGVSRWRTPLAIYAEKKGTNLWPEADNNYMRRGRWFEWAILAGLRDLYPSWRFVKANVFLVDRAHRLGGTPDFVAVDPERPGYGIIDGKTVTRRVFVRDWLRYEDDEDAEEIEDTERAVVPIEHQLQALLYAKLAGASWAAVAPLVVSEHRADLLLRPVELHEGAWARCLSEAAYFWREFDAGRKPAYSRELDNATLRALYPAALTDPETPVDLSGHNRVVELLEARAALKARIKADEEEIEKLETDVIAIMGEAAVALAADGWRIGYKVEHREAVTMAAWTKRVLRITKRKGKRRG